MADLPIYWKTTLANTDDAARSVSKGRVRELCRSAGGHPVYLFLYGKENSLDRTANLSSALGALAPEKYADKSHPSYRPTVFLTGCVHGGEFEGTAALLNLINILETGADLKGEAHGYISEMAEKVNFLIIPIANPDGRMRVPFESFVGRDIYDLRYYNQGTWKNGGLCSWPGCKSIHPIKDAVDYLGGYFNEDGVNMMHDSFFGGASAETQAILDVTEKYAPDFSVLLHGWGEGDGEHAGVLLKTPYAPKCIAESAERFDRQFAARAASEGFSVIPNRFGSGEDKIPPVAFNLNSAMVQLCGAPSVTYESDQGLLSGAGVSHEELYKLHMILFEELCRFVCTEKGETIF